MCESLTCKALAVTYRLNEIKIAAPMLDTIEIKGRAITAGALLMQRELANYLVKTRKAHYHFTVKANQKE